MTVTLIPGRALISRNAEPCAGIKEDAHPVGQEGEVKAK